MSTTAADYLEHLDDDLAEMDAGAEAQGADGLLGRRADTVEPEPVTWLWPGRLARGKLAIVEGDPGGGKSTLTLDLAARVSTGRPWPDGAPCAVGSSLILSAEDSAGDTICPRLIAAGADLSRIRIVPVTLENEGETELLSIPEHLPLIEDTIAREHTKLVIIDPLDSFLSSAVDSNKNHDVRRALAALSALAERTGAAVIVVRHLNKSGGANPLYRGGGSIGLIAAARSAFLVAKDRRPGGDGRRVVACLKSNLALEPSSLAFRLVQAEGDSVAHVEWIDGPCDVTARDLLSEPEGPGRHGSLDKALELLNEELADGPRPAGEILEAARAAGISARTLTSARRALGVRASKTGFSQGWKLALPRAQTPIGGNTLLPSTGAAPVAGFSEGRKLSSYRGDSGEIEAQIEQRRAQEEAEIDRLAAEDSDDGGRPWNEMSFKEQAALMKKHMEDSNRGKP